MRSPSYRERDYAFGQATLTLRSACGLTQEGLADLLGVSRQAVVGWEAGSSYPQAQHLKHFLTLCVQRRAFPPGREADEIRAFWKAAHQKVLLDENWLADLLVGLRYSPLPAAPQPTGQPNTSEQAAAHRGFAPRVDWESVLAVPAFYGREREMALLSAWVLDDRCQVVSVLGLGGIGKSALAVRLMHQLADHFDVMIWRSVRDAPSCEAFLDDCIRVLAPEPLGEVPTSLEHRIDLLMECLVSQRVLLVIDNFETVLEEGPGSGHSRPGYEGYGRLLRRIAENQHQSCLLLTSRDKPRELVSQTGNLALVRTLRIAGLETAACAQMLSQQGLTGTLQEQEALIDRYGGNPLALRIVAQTIIELFGSEIAPFLEQGEVVFGEVRELLAEQFDRLSRAEQSTLLWLAILREPVTINELLAIQALPLARAEVLEALDALRRRSLIEPGQLPGSFTLQSVVLEYATARLIADATREIEQGNLDRLIDHGLGLATTREYIREVNGRLLITPILERLRSIYTGPNGVEGQLITLLSWLRQRSIYAQGYGPKNMLRLLRALRGHLRGLDLSHLLIRGAALQGVEMQDTNLSGATLQDTVFAETFDAITAVAISSNGRYWAAGSMRGKVWVWGAEGKTMHWISQAHADAIYALAFSPDGRTLATGSWDCAIKLWNMERGALLWTSWSTDSIVRLAFAPDGRTLASGGDDAAVRLWDAQRGTLLQTFQSQGGLVYALAWSPDGRLLASAGLDTHIRLWEMQETQPGTSVRMLTGHTNLVLGLAFAPDGRTLASGSWDRTVKLWDVESLSERQTLTGHTDWVFRVTWSPDGRLLASCGADRKIWLWDFERASSRTVLHGHTSVVSDIAFTPDSRSLLSGSEDNTLRVWDVERGQCALIMQGYAVSLHDIAWSPDGGQLASAGSDTLVTIWDAADRTPARVLRGHSLIVNGVTWSPDGRWLASSSWDHAVRVWDASTGACVQTLWDPDHDDTPFQGIGWSPDGKWLAVGTFERGVQVWEVTTGSRRWVSRAEPTRIRRVAWSTDGTQLASGGDDGNVCLWEVSDGTLLAKLQGHRGKVMSVTWSPDGTRLASCGGLGSGELFIWDALSAERLSTLNEPGAVINAVAWSQSGSVLVSGGSDGMLRWWDLQHGECVRVQKAHKGAIHSLKRSPDGQRLASCGDDGAINIWALASGEKMQTLRRDRPYERMDISGVLGLTEAQRATLRTLGAIEKPA